MDWNQVFQTAKEECCLRKFMLGLYLAKLLCDAPLPRQVELDIIKDKMIAVLGGKVVDQLLMEHSLVPEFTANPRFSPFHIKVQDDMVNKVRFVLRQIFMPTAKEISLLPLPKFLVFIYYIYRPLRLLWRLMLYYLPNRSIKDIIN